MTRAVGYGTGSLREGGRVDFDRLRADRRRRLFAAMADEGVDVLLLGRAANIAFATGSRLLWTAGHKPFSVGCVIVRRTGRMHLLSTWDEGVPEEIGREDLFGLSWNPAIATARLKGIEGAAGAAVLASDGWSPSAQTLIEAVFPGASLGDAGPLLRRSRSAKSWDEVACIHTAVCLAEGILGAIREAVRPGVSSRQLVARYGEAAASLGSTSPPTEAVIWTSPPERPGVSRRSWPWRLPSDRPLVAGELVGLNPGAFYAGYEGTLGRTLAVGGEASDVAMALDRRCREGLDATIAACRLGATGFDLLAAWKAATGVEPPEVLARGVGLGTEPPIIGRGVGGAEVIDAGVVLAVSGSISSPGGDSGVLAEDVVLVGADGPTILTRYSSLLLQG